MGFFAARGYDPAIDSLVVIGKFRAKAELHQAQAARNFLEFVEGVTPLVSKRPRQVIKTMIRIKFEKLLEQPITQMQSRSTYPIQRRSRITLGVCALILLGMLFGAMVSPMGGVRSHGLAAFAANQHEVDAISLDVHGHAHDDNDVKPTISDAGADHPHHSADHSHDKSHGPSIAMTFAMAMASAWPATARPWVKLVEAFRLERPPMV